MLRSPAMMRSWRWPGRELFVPVGDSYTQVAVDQELAAMGATPDEVGSTFVVLAAAMLVEACGSKAEAAALAARWTRRITARSARAVNARDASVA
jgi:hypothetical protein